MTDIINTININYNTNNNEIYYVSFIEDNNEKWYKYEIICSYNLTNNTILWAPDMLLIPHKIKSNIKIKFDNLDNNEDFEKKINKKLDKKYLKIIANKQDNFKIYLGLTKKIKT